MIEMSRQFEGTTDKMQWDGSAQLVKQSTKYTVCAWAFPDSTSAAGHTVVENGGVGGYASILRRNGSDWEVVHKANAGDIIAKDTSGVTAGVWSHMLGTWDGTGTTTIYKNGISKGTASPTDMVANRAGVRVSIGYAFDGGGERWNGRIADVAVWQEVLTLPEIRQLAYGIKRPNEIRPQALVGYYPFDSTSLWGKGRVTSPAVITGGAPSMLSDPPFVAPRPTKLLLPYVPYTSIGHRRFVTPFRVSHI